VRAPYLTAWLLYPVLGDTIVFMNRSQTSHADIVLRLKRAEGHLRSTISMIEAGRHGVDIAQQLQAIEKAVINARKAFIHQQVDRFVALHAEADAESARAILSELKEISKYL
jgi:DNA-binding FrmR family transcriptional regulator